MFRPFRRTESRPPFTKNRDRRSFKSETEFHYTIFSRFQPSQFFFSTDHLQRFESEKGLGKEWVPVSGTLPMYVVPRKELPDGLVDTLEKYLLIFHNDDEEIPNPDPKFQPDYRPVHMVGRK